MAKFPFIFCSLLLINVIFDSSFANAFEEDDLTDSFYVVARYKRDDEDVTIKKSTTKKPSQLNKDEQGKKQITKSSLKLGTVTENNTQISFDDDDEEATLPPNANQTIDEHHSYYNSTFLSEPEAMTYWVNVTAFPKHKSVLHEMLSNSHRRAATVALPFDFLFYGHPMKNITIATGGFLYAGDHVHSWLAATQYIAALMANFDTRLSNDSTIQYASNETHFVVQWSDVMLQDHNGSFSFQIILVSNGDIIFVYKDVPFPIQDIPESKHPVKVGISDAYVIDRTVFFIRRKTIYEYHRIDLKQSQISNNTAIYFKALPNCISLTSCEACLTAKIGFQCGWCDAANRCSDGFDRHRQDWLTRNCEQAAKEEKCTSNATTTTTTSTTAIPSNKEEKAPASENPSSALITGNNSGKNSGSAGLISVLFIFAFISGFAIWILYAYKNPQTTSGQLLIKYRPNQWRWRGGETRYTAASIHM